MLVLIGSQALKFHSPELLTREPKDVDVIGSFDSVNALFSERRNREVLPSVVPFQGSKKMLGRGPKLIVEAEIAWDESTGADFIRLVAGDPETKLGLLPEPLFGEALIPSLDALYALKMSHRYLKNSPHFRKTMMDIRRMRAHGAKISERYADWFKAREKATYTYKHPNLNQEKMGFFSGDGVKYVYDHDTIHVSVAQQERPAYTYFQKDGAQVAVDRKKWDQLPYNIQIASVLEESYVLALERSQIPFPGMKTPRESFEMALMKVCTSITSGWWREFAWENYFEALKRYDDAYVTKFWHGVETGLVKKIQVPAQVQEVA